MRFKERHVQPPTHAQRLARGAQNGARLNNDSLLSGISRLMPLEAGDTSRDTTFDWGEKDRKKREKKGKGSTLPTVAPPEPWKVTIQPSAQGDTVVEGSATAAPSAPGVHDVVPPVIFHLAEESHLIGGESLSSKAPVIITKAKHAAPASEAQIPLKTHISLQDPPAPNIPADVTGANHDGMIPGTHMTAVVPVADLPKLDTKIEPSITQDPASLTSINIGAAPAAKVVVATAGTVITPIKRTSIQAPTPGKVVVVLDATAVIDLCDLAALSSNSGKDTPIHFIEKMLHIPHIDKVVIPEHVLDFETKGVVRKYNGPGNYFEAQVRSTLRPQRNKMLSMLLKGAVRRHIDANGNECFLSEPGVTPNDKIVIWETQLCREMANVIYDKVFKTSYGRVDQAGKPDTIANQNKGKNIVSQDYTGKNSGEHCIDAFTDHELPNTWKNPCLIVSDDTKNLERKDLQAVTINDNAKLYMSMRGLLNSIFRFNPDVVPALTLSTHSFKGQASEAINKINSLRDKPAIDPNWTPIMRGNRTLIDKEAALAALIPVGMRVIALNNALKEQPVKAVAALDSTLTPSFAPAERKKVPPLNSDFAYPPAQTIETPAALPHSSFASAPARVSTKTVVSTATPDAAALEASAAVQHVVHAAPSVNNMSLREALVNGMIEQDLSYDGVVKAINKLTPHMPAMTPLELVHIISGKEKPLDDHFYAFLDVMVTHNPHIKPEDKVKEALALRQLYQHSDIEHAHTKQTLGDYIGESMVQMKKTDFAVLADELNAQIKQLHVKTEEVTPQMIGKIVLGQATPSDGLALALRKALDINPEAFDHAYIAAKYTRPASEGSAASL